MKTTIFALGEEIFFIQHPQKRESIIRQFVGKELLTRKGNMVKYNQDAYINDECRNQEK